MCLATVYKEEDNSVIFKNVQKQFIAGIAASAVKG